MTQPAAFLTALPIAANSAEGNAPEWVQVTPAGPDVQGRDGRAWRMTDPSAIIRAFEANAADLPIDFEHSTQVKGSEGEAAPAVGWIKELEVRNGALWARVEWNDAGREAVSSRAYRYLSPVFTFSQAAREVGRLVSAGLTNAPNLKMAALNRDGKTPTKKETTMDKAILDALGLAEEASTDDALVAINKLKADEQTARNRAATPDPSSFVPRADFDLAQNRISQFEAADKARLDAEIEAKVGAAVQAGKIAPASRDYHLAACRVEGGVEAFDKMVGDLPEIVTPAAKRGSPEGEAANTSKLSDEELATCRALGMSEEDFIKAKADTSKE